MSKVIWINPVVKGSCDSRKCGAACCYCKVYTDSENYTTHPCPELDLETLKCKIYDTRPEGCRTYPSVLSFTSASTFPNCGYYLEEDQTTTD